MSCARALRDVSPRPAKCVKQQNALGNVRTHFQVADEFYDLSPDGPEVVLFVLRSKLKPCGLPVLRGALLLGESRAQVWYGELAENFGFL